MGVVICPECGARNSAILESCGKCGADLKEVETISATEDHPPRRLSVVNKIWDWHDDRAQEHAENQDTRDHLGLLKTVIGPLDTLAAVVMVLSYSWMRGQTHFSGSLTDLSAVGSDLKLIGDIYAASQFAFVFLTLVAIYLLATKND